MPAAAAAIVESIIDLAHRLGMEVVAEGVEDEATLSYLDAHGVDLVQGYHLGRPMPAEDVALAVGAARQAAAA